MSDSDERLLMLIDDEPAQARLICAITAREGWRCLVVPDAQTAYAKLASREGAGVSAILLDQWVPGDEACTLIAELKQQRPGTPILMLTASASPLLAVEAMRAGATDYLIKPVSADRLLQALRGATARAQPRDELQPLSEKLTGAIDFDAMIGDAPAFRSALAQAAKVARSHSNVLVQGESGTGKEMVLRAIHAASPRAKAPLKAVSAAGMAVSSMESLLFGHEQNAFPGAFDSQPGVLQSLDGGTLLLEDVDRLDPAVQTRLAETLKTGIVRPIGARHGYRVDVRLLCSSNSDMAALCEAGVFSRDLLERIAPVTIALPPLRERSSDIPALTRHFLRRIGEQPGLRHHSITDSALSLLAAYDWPGNVRQLQAALFRAAVFCDDESLTTDSFPQLFEMLGNVASPDDQRLQGLGVLLYREDGNLRPLEEIEADVIRLAIVHYSGRMTEVARRLGIGRSTLYRKLTVLGIENVA
ncbi:sigma-54-dependent Fis family transcriptional regulator [Erythrobacteraceae bacterium CFH 75059]|uniref:sigma-54-dependent transcriptional regulator n=1 Tax=Qipengyuania thermophila TaxID=2509361 RepID=UPI0010222E1A|nr:sigma-54 dependent transcriptional regulator [Qipengyuania thermophila]TCD04899.1 sigma-54-dependent Fis family transcriptional regulator [Erythrobacteraceae bacterium CFH 75059]